MKKYFIVSCIILMISVSACTPGSVTRPTTEMIESLATSIPTETPLIILPTSTPTTPPTTIEPNPASSQELTEECLQINQQTHDELGLSGVWVINPGAPKLNNLDDQMFYGVPLDGGGSLLANKWDLAISPSGQHMAYIDNYVSGVPFRAQKRVLRVIRSSGHSLNMSYWPEQWQWIIGWVDDQNLALYTSNKKIVILNPLTGTWRTFEQPEWLAESDNRYHYGYWNLPGYSPNLEWVIERTEDRVALRDIGTSEVAWEKEGDYWTDWVWSHDSTTTAITYENKVFVLKNGKESTVFDLAKSGYSRVYDLELSFDGQKLAFNISSEGDYGERLAIWNIEQNKLFKLCDKNYSGRVGDGPIWSPDGRFVIQKVYGSQYRYFDVLIDTQTMQAYFSESDYFRGQIAWLAKP